MPIITDERIKVTEQMLSDANMLSFGKIGIPVDVNNLSKGLAWKSFSELKISDFDALEDYFLLPKEKRGKVFSLKCGDSDKEINSMC